MGSQPLKPVRGLSRESGMRGREGEKEGERKNTESGLRPRDEKEERHAFTPSAHTLPKKRS